MAGPRIPIARHQAANTDYENPTLAHTPSPDALALETPMASHLNSEDNPPPAWLNSPQAGNLTPHVGPLNPQRFPKNSLKKELATFVRVTFK